MTSQQDAIENVAKDDETISFEDAMKMLDEQGEKGMIEEDDAPPVWALVKYEEGTSGPIKTIEGILIDDSAGLTLLDPESGDAHIVGDRFIITATLTQLALAEDEGEDEA